MKETLSAVTVVLAASWLIGLAVAAIIKPQFVKDFFDKFASSAFTHCFEMFLRLVFGAAFVIYGPQMRFPFVFTAFGWLLIGTTAVLMFVPWKLHRKFADKSLPMVTDRMPLFAVISLLGGAFILYSFFFTGTQ